MFGDLQNRAKVISARAPVMLETLEPRMLLSSVGGPAAMPDLWATASFTSDYFADYLAPGDRGTVGFTVHNSGDGSARGVVNVNVYLSTDDQLDPDTDVLLAGNVRASLRLSPSRSKTVYTKVDIPLDLKEGSYYLLVDVDTTNVIDELVEGNNVGVSATPRDVKYLFGYFHGRHVALTLTDTASGQPVDVTFAIKGKGYGVIEGDSTPESPGYDITLKNTSGSCSYVDINTEGGRTYLISLLVLGSVRSFDAPTTDVIGNIQVDGYVGTVTLGDVGTGDGGDISITIDQVSRQWADFQFDMVTNLSIDSAQKIGDISAFDWVDTGGEKDLVQAPLVDRIIMSGDDTLGLAGDFEADVNVYYDWYYRNPYIGDIIVNGTVRNAQIRSEGDIDSVSIGAADNADFLAGIETGIVQPINFDDFVQVRVKEYHHWGWQYWDLASGRIGEFTVNGLAADPDGNDFVNSNIAAGSIGQVNLRNMPTDNGGVQFGIFAAADNTYDNPIDLVTIYDTLDGNTVYLRSNDFPYADTDFVIDIIG